MCMFSELSRVIEALGKERGVERSVVVNAIEQAFLLPLGKSTVSRRIRDSLQRARNANIPI